LGFLGWIYLVFHHVGYFNLGGEIAYEGNEKRLCTLLDSWPQDTPLPIILFRKFTSESSPPFKWGLVKRKRAGSEGGCCVIIVFVETDLTINLLNQPSLFKRRYILWSLEDNGDVGSTLRKLGVLDKLEGHLGIIIQALEASDKLTKWLRGGVGWVAGPKPNIALHDFAVGFEPEWKRKPLTPEKLVH
jgi:hypothetical protein